MPQRSYGRLCGLSRALELVGDRWTLVIMRQLLVGPRRYSDLHASLPQLSTNLLADRLKRLEADGLVIRRELPPPAAATVYELTEFGARIEPAILELLRWGAALLGDPERSSEPSDPDWPLFPIRWLARKAPGRETTIDITVGESPVLPLLVDGTSASLRTQPDSPAICSIHATAAPYLGAVLSGAITLSAAIADGNVTTDGDCTWIEGALNCAYSDSDDD